MATHQPTSSPDPWYIEALATLNRVSESVNQVRAGDPSHLNDTLRIVSEAAGRLVRSSWAAVVLYDPEFKKIILPDHVRFSLDTSPYAITFPEHLALLSLNEHTPLFSNERPPGMHLFESSVSACYPLIAGEVPVGVLVIVTHSQVPFTSGEKIILSNLANLATAAFHQAGHISEIQRNLKRKEEELHQLRRAGLLISSRLQLEETLIAILQMALEITNAQYGIFRLVDKTGQRLITRAVAGESLARPLVDVIPITANSVMSWVARNRQAICISDLRSEPWREIYYPLDPALDMRSELAVPLVSASGRLEGVLNLESPRIGAFTEQDSHILQSLATQAVIAIQEVRLLDTLQEVAQLLLTQSCQKVLSRLVGLSADLLNGDASAIWILKNGRLQLQASRGLLHPNDHLELDNSLAGEVISNRSTRTILGEESWEYPDLLDVEGPVSALVVPLVLGGSHDPAGVLAVFSVNPETTHFAHSEWDHKVLTCLAYYAALAVQYASHQEALRAAQEQRAVAETFAAIGDIAANVLHHLNNKVGTIPVRIQGIRDKCEITLQRDAYLNSNLNEIERSANEAMESVRESLSHLRPITLADVDVSTCITSAIESARLPIGIEVTVDSLSHLPVVTAAQKSLSLVFTNLLDNASNAMHGHGKINIAGKVDGDWVEIILSDSGPGIAPELHDRIFELSYSGRGQARGTKLGFGLWWVKTWMARLGGSVAVESDGKNGATFHVKLPIAQRKS